MISVIVLSRLALLPVGPLAALADVNIVRLCIAFSSLACGV